jgi:DNA-binding NarL/FixJ family response regulator
VKCILIADDSPFVRHSLRRVFREEGWDVCEEASDGREAIAKAQQVKPNVIVLDLSMPGMNGITVAHILKKIVPDTHLILYTLFPDLLSPEEIRSSGFSAIVSKNEVGKLAMKAQRLADCRVIRPTPEPH